MNTSPILLIADDTNLRLSLCSILERTQFTVKSAAYLCVPEVRSQANTYALFFYAIDSVYDLDLACAYLQDDMCLVTPIVFLCEPLFARILQQTIRDCCHVEILITPIEPEQIITAAQNILLTHTLNPDQTS